MKNSILLIVCSFVLSIFFGCSRDVVRPEKAESGVIDADDPDIQYVGRFDFSDPKKVVFDWAGVFISAKFSGTSCSVRLNDKENEYAVIVDRRAPRLLKTDSLTKVYSIASGLTDSILHTIMIQKRTEPLVGAAEFSGFILDSGRTLLTPDKRSERRIEFIGNSITSGYGVEGDSSDCHFSPQTENAGMTYAAMTARELNADYHLVSFSGRGVVRNYGDSNKTSVDPMPALYNRVCFSDTVRKWDFSRWVPQVVVINLGTNDFSTQPFPDKAVFQTAYLQLINRVRALYPGVTIFCVCGPMIEEPCMSYIREVVAAEQKGKRDKDVFYVGIARNVLADADWGCDFHPNIFGMNKMSDMLTAAIKLRMNW